jgi:hypothetical protein
MLQTDSDTLSHSSYHGHHWLCAGILYRAEVLGAGIRGGLGHPGCIRHEAEVPGLQVLYVGHEPQPTLLRAESSERTPVLSHQPSRVNPRYAASCVGVSQASHSGEHQLRQPDLADAAVCDDNNQRFGSSLEVPAHLFCRRHRS